MKTMAVSREIEGVTKLTVTRDVRTAAPLVALLAAVLGCGDATAAGGGGAGEGGDGAGGAAEGGAQPRTSSTNCWAIDSIATCALPSALSLRYSPWLN